MTPGVAWQAAGLPRGLRGSPSVGIGEGNEPERAPSTTGTLADGEKKKEGRASVHPPPLRLAGGQPKQMLCADSVTRTLQGGYL